jgi:hypothetical protein
LKPSETLREIAQRLEDELWATPYRAQKVTALERELSALLDEIAVLAEDFDVETYGGYYRSDDGRKTLYKLAEAIRTLKTRAFSVASTTGTTGENGGSDGE